MGANYSGSGPWYGDERRRALFEWGARRWRSLRRATVTTGSDRGRHYALPIDVPSYEPRHVEMVFRLDSPHVPRVYVDGPSKSPHRYHADDGRLCLFHPYDPADLQWTLNDGLLRLIGHTAAHLFREAWWRETGEWLGPEAPHSLDKEPLGAGAERWRPAARNEMDLTAIELTGSKAEAA